ncbi:hypothetical protein NKOR_00640 [Candidatus Nitrosopumilus koreensis AR1]|uniref:Uncharacterized protein n=1 Tax=Candidatus Nitrosopumilus koreensis AR1 TaxID=1229908 RepID=K0B6D1_9ARCH|nr:MULTISPECIES: hypothetical protein [Nitrosopumilus]AFS80046.1 hypothetical protein NKOR_00640 [Candidatus Nitrosopumilus koreensis AR1]
MSKREPSIVEFIEWIKELDDPYKVFLFSLFSAISLYVIVQFGHDIDPATINEIFLGELIKSLGNETLIWFWANVFQPVSAIAGILELIVLLYAIFRLGIIGLFVSITGFIGWIILIFRITLDWIPEIFYVGVVLVLISAIIAKINSNLDFDEQGSVRF